MIDAFQTGVSIWIHSELAADVHRSALLWLHTLQLNLSHQQNTVPEMHRAVYTGTWTINHVSGIRTCLKWKQSKGRAPGNRGTAKLVWIYIFMSMQNTFKEEKNQKKEWELLYEVYTVELACCVPCGASPVRPGRLCCRTPLDAFGMM